MHRTYPNVLYNFNANNNLNYSFTVCAWDQASTQTFTLLSHAIIATFTLAAERSLLIAFVLTHNLELKG